MKKDSFKDFVCDQLKDLGDVRCIAMFGGHGLYLGDVFFGILDRGCLYFRTDSDSRAKYKAAGMKPFRPSTKQTLKNYYEVPPDILEDPDQIVLWAREAECIQRNRRPSKPQSSVGKGPSNSE